MHVELQFENLDVPVRLRQENVLSLPFVDKVPETTVFLILLTVIA